MVKLLVKKELKTLFRTYFVNQKTGKGYSKGKTAGFIALFAVLMLFLMGVFFAMGSGIASAFVPAGYGWFYFAIMGMMALGLGIFGDVFNTYAMLYKAKDNELLFSLPIPPSKILISRMTVVFLMGLMYESLVYIPTVVAFWIGARGVVGINVGAAIVSQILIFLFLGIFITSVTCLLGWLVALLSNKLKYKNIAVLILSIVFFAAYYLICMKMGDFITSLITNMEAFGNKVKSAFYPAYAFGVAGTGDLLNALIFSLFSLVLFVIITVVLSLSFRKITTTKNGDVKKKYTGVKGKRSGIYWALWKREGKRFVSIPTYTLNAGLGILFMPVMLVLLIVKRDMVIPMIEMISETPYAPLIPMAVGSMMAFMVSMDCGAAPSVSLEGKTLWILKSSPINMGTLMRSKIDFHFSINAIPAFILALVGGFVLSLSVLDTVILTVLTVAITYLVNAFGLMLGTVRANLEWTNPIVPIKQSMAVMITLFGGWAVAIIYPLGWYLMRSFMPPLVWKLLYTSIIVGADIYLAHWCLTKGAKRVMEL